ncbi:MAG: glycosyltransferase family 4 protein [Phycisphaeraceae bacterium]|nr:glycosyltransferase family 4 protein [Phycisphaeraceae bacterium]
MKLIFLTPGTGNFHCGNCLRDNALAMALRRSGHEAMMVPLYLPMVTDHEEVDSNSPIFFGGLNVYLQHKSSVFRRSPAWLDRLLNARPLLRFAAGHSHMTQAAELGSITVSMLKGEEGRQHKELDKLIAFLKTQPKPDAICLSNALLIGLVRRLRHELEVPVLVTLQGEDAFLDTLPEPHRTEAWGLMAERAREVDAFVGVSRYYGGLMQKRLGLTDGQMHTIYNGIDPSGYRPADKSPDPPVIGFLARLCPGKGPAALADAFVELKKRGRHGSLKLHLAGAMTRGDEPYVQSIRRKLDAAGVGKDVQVSTNLSLEQKQQYLRSLSVLSVPAMYGEAFGLYLLEAWASGVPVVQPRHGAFEELLTDTRAGILCESDAPEPLADAIESLLDRPDHRAELGRLGREAVLERFNIDRMADQTLQLVEQLKTRPATVPAKEEGDHGP